VTAGFPATAANARLEAVARHGQLRALAVGLCLASPASGGGAAAGEEAEAPPRIAPAAARTGGVVGAAAAGQTGADSQDRDFTYRIGAEDDLRITVRGEEELSRIVTVQPDGRITLPLAGAIPAVGRTPQALRGAIADNLSAYIESPQVTVTVETATGTFPHRIRIIGDALAPESLAYRDGMSALDAITEIGGLPETAAADSAYILRGRDGAQERIPLRLGTLLEQGRMAANRALEPGDVIVVPEGFFSGEWSFNASLGASETYTDNINLAPAPLRDSALISELVPSVEAEVDTARVQGALDATVRLQYLAETDVDDFQVGPEVRGVTNAELIEEFLFTDVSASITRSLVDTQRGQSINQSNLQNQGVTQTYRVSPYVQTRFARFARLEARYIGEAVFIEEGEGNRDIARSFGADDSIENTGRLELESGPQFSIWSWTLSGEWSNIDLEDREDRRRREALLHSELAVSPSFTLIAEGGWEIFEGNDFNRDIDDPVGLGGFRWSPSPSTEMEALAGFDDGDETFRANLRHEFGSSLVFTASYDERADIDQGRLGRTLPDSPDDLDDPDRGDGTDLTLRGDPTRTETLQASLRGQISTTTLTLTGRYETRELGVLGGQQDEDLVSVSASFSQPLTRSLVLSGSGRFEDRSFEAIDDVAAAREDDTYFANAGLSYTGLRRFDLSLRYTYTKRASNRLLQDFRENAATLTIRAAF